MSELDETVLTIQQRVKRAQILRAHEKRLERAREVAKKRSAPDKTIKKRAYVKARQMVRRIVAGDRGAEYEKLGPSEKMQVDRAVEKKAALVKKIALRLIPRVKQAEQKRLSSFIKGQSIQNQGKAEGHHTEKSAVPGGAVTESMDDRFANAFKGKPKESKNSNKNVIMYSTFDDEANVASPVAKSIKKKAVKSGVAEEILGYVYDRGMAAWTEETGVSQQQYAFARVNSYINQGKTYFDEDADLHEGRAPGKAYVAPFNDEQGNQRGWKSSDKWGKVKYWQPHAKKSALKHAGLQEEEVQQTNENFIDGKGPGKPGDAARHGLKGKSASELKKIRSSETASPRKKQLAHWMLNMHHNEETEIQELSATTINAYRRGMEKDVATNPDIDPKKKAQRERGFKTSTKKILGLAKVNATESLKDPEDNPCWKGYKPVGTKKKGGKTVPNCVPVNEEERPNPKAKVEGTNCRNCSYWREDLEKPVTKEELNPNGGLKAPNKEYIAMSKRIDLGTLPGKDSSVKVKGFCDHDSIKDWVTERMCCSQWDSDGMVRDYKGQSPVMEDDTGNGTNLVDKESRNSKARKKIEVVDRKAPYTDYIRHAEIKTKVIDEEHTNCGTPECCGQCDTAVVEKIGNTQNDPKKRLVGTDSLVKAYKKDTPFSESLDESFNIAFAAGVGVTLTAADLGMKVKGGFAYHPSVIEQMDEMEEEVKSADVKGVIVRTATGKTVVRKQKVDRKIIGSGNLKDGIPDDTF